MNVTTTSWWMRALLVASLALNSVLATWILWKPVAPAAVAAYQALPLGALARTLNDVPEADRTMLTNAMVRRASALKAADDRYREAARQALRELSAESLNIPDLERAVTEARHARQDAADELLAAVYEALPNMSAEGRRRLIASGNKLAHVDR